MRRIRVFVVGLLMLWLPLQAVAAVSMPFCAHAGSRDAAHAAVPERHHHTGSMPGSDGHGQEQSDQHRHPAAGSLQQCNDCGACNLACAPAVPASVVLALAAPATVEPDFLAQSCGLFVPEQPQPPPNSDL
jgi:hypothetical protein